MYKRQARALINRPEVLLADEPTGNLDHENAAEIMKLLERINALGTTVDQRTGNRYTLLLSAGKLRCV